MAAENASRDQNFVPTIIAASSTDGVTPTKVYADPATHRLLVNATAGVVGPLSSTDNAVARWDGTTGLTIQDSSVFILDNGNVGIGTAAPTVSLEVVGSTHLDPTGIGTVSIGNAGTEANTILVDGVTYTAETKVSDISNADTGLLLLHKHSTTAPGIQAFARSNTDDATHAPLTNGQVIGSVVGLGWTGANGYQNAGQVEIAIDDSGTINATSAPGKITLSVSPSGAVTPVAALTIVNNGNATFAGTVDATKYQAGGTNPVADGTYTVGAMITPSTGTVGTITVKGGIITAIQQAQ